MPDAALKPPARGRLDDQVVAGTDSGGDARLAEREPELGEFLGERGSPGSLRLAQIGALMRPRTLEPGRSGVTIGARDR